MRRTPSHIDHVDAATATGGSVRHAVDFDHAYDELATARAQYDRYVGDPASVPSLADAAKRLADARATMTALRASTR